MGAGVDEVSGGAVFQEYTVRSGPSECRFLLETHGRIVSLVDRSPDYPGRPMRSLTNGMDEVVGFLFKSGLLPPGCRLVYRDTEGVWDEAQVDHGRRRFADFRCLGMRDLDLVRTTLELEMRR